MTKLDTQKTEKPQDKSSDAKNNDEIRDEALDTVSGGRRSRPGI